ncbi:MAG: hypothetical protein U1E76_14895 [Planctomycetota bacterium]
MIARPRERVYASIVRGRSIGANGGAWPHFDLALVARARPWQLGDLDAAAAGLVGRGQNR